MFVHSCIMYIYFEEKFQKYQQNRLNLIIQLNIYIAGKVPSLITLRAETTNALPIVIIWLKIMKIWSS